MNEIAATSVQSTRGRWAMIILILLEIALIVSWSAGFIGVRFASDPASIFLT